MKRTRKNAAQAQQQPPWDVCYCAGAGPRLTALAGGMCQGPMFDHFRSAGVEVLKGFRAILDAQIEILTRQQKKGTRVPVE
ncbi:MAG: hypothetical protein HY236_13180 [Acidobacteria bacterium]|nr:hypothetical protein [Acidobacteriota bacterium]